MENILKNAPLAFYVEGIRDGQKIIAEKPDKIDGDFAKQTAKFKELGITVTVEHKIDTKIFEKITIKNNKVSGIKFKRLIIGLALPYDESKHLFAVPYRVQQDGWRHDYDMDTLQNGRYEHIINSRFPEGKVYGNSVYSDSSRIEPELLDEGILRSEAWCYGNDEGGIMAIKYNNTAIEYPLCRPTESGLIFGGSGVCLYGEPAEAYDLGGKMSFTFAETEFLKYDKEDNPFYIYRQYLNDKGHNLPKDYCPSVHWNELYDIGWHHSVREKLLKYYSKEALFEEARKAKEMGCGTLYLDPGWEFAEGLGWWDNQRLGELSDFIAEIKERYGLKVALRTIVRTYINYWPSDFITKRTEDDLQLARMVPPTMITSNQIMWEICASNPLFLNEKKKRVLELAKQGLSFIMFDESDWRGACYCKTHGHSKYPSVPSEHAEALLSLTKEIHDKCPQVVCELHDPVWPWNSARYLPSYYKQGWGEKGCYHENWGFEFMWDCINDLKSGKALSSYYYCMSCDIPLYLHINMGADNDNCIFFWWAASTIRHLGLGGKNNHPTVEPPNKLAPYDHEKRYASYIECMKDYNKYKDYFTTGKFIGIAENVHLHKLSGKNGGVINLFNIEDDERNLTFEVSAEDLGSDKLNIIGADSFEWQDGICKVTATLKGLSHRLIVIE